MRTLSNSTPNNMLPLTPNKGIRKIKWSNRVLANLSDNWRYTHYKTIKHIFYFADWCLAILILHRSKITILLDETSECDKE